MKNHTIPLKFEKNESEINADSQYSFIKNRLDEIKVNAKKNGKRIPKEALTAEFLLKEMLTYRQFKEPGSLCRELLNTENQQMLTQECIAQHINQTKKEILNEYANLNIEYIGMLALYDHTFESYKRIFKYLFDAVVKQSKDATSRGNKRNELHDRDNARLLECLSMLSNKLQREFIESDLREYIRLVKRTYPEQLYIQKPRLTKEEKTLSKEDREFILNEKIKKRGKGWVDSRIIEFFNSNTNLIGTTK